MATSTVKPSPRPSQYASPEKMIGEASNKKTKAFLNVTASEISPAAELITNNVDLLTEILLRLPVKSIIRFKSVSKHWFSLLSDFEFATIHFTRCSSISGLYFYAKTRSTIPSFISDMYFYTNEVLHYISLQGRCLHLPSLSFIDGVKQQWKIEVEDSCNGLLLCYVKQHDYYHFGRDNYYHDGVQYIVCNPTTKKYRLLPKPDGVRCLVNGFLAFDPKKSSRHYKVVLLNHTEIHIYSSQSLCWKKVLPNQKCDGKKVFWNGAIHWFTSDKYLKRFDVDEEEIIAMPNTQTPSPKTVTYFGECGGGLILVQSFSWSLSELKIFELEKGYSGWVVKCRVNLKPLISEFPEMGEIGKFNLSYRYTLLQVVEGEDERGIALIISTPQRIIAYYPKSKAWEQLLDLAPFGSKYLGFIDYALPSIETLFPV